MVFLLHVIGCIWAAIAVLTIDEERDNWIRDKDITNDSLVSKYISSCYWAVVTISTVGYGDITPTNDIEMITTIILMFVGVTMYSYIISRLTSIFAQVNSKSEDQTKEKLIKAFVAKAHLDDKTSSQVITFFQKSDDNLIHASKEMQVD